MSNTPDSETKRGATEKAWEGARLLAAGDYDGAIAACDEAIRLYPSSTGAIRTRDEAFRQGGGRGLVRACSYCGLKFLGGDYTYNWHLKRLHRCPPEGAARVQERMRKDTRLKGISGMKPLKRDESTLPALDGSSARNIAGGRARAEIPIVYPALKNAPEGSPSSKNPPEGSPPSVGVVLFSLIIMIPIVWFLAVKSYEWESWPTTKGTLQSLKSFVTAATYNGDFPEFAVNARYTFQVNGVEYAGSETFYLEACGLWRCMDRRPRVEAEFRRRTIVVHYKPENPAKKPGYLSLVSEDASFAQIPGDVPRTAP